MGKKHRWSILRMKTAPFAARSVAIWCILFAAVLAFLGAEIVSYSRNTLENHPEWVSAKLFLSHNVMGANRGVRTRNLLHRNRLNLHEWHGFNEVLLNEVFAFGTMKLSFLLGSDSYLCVIFNKIATSVSGVRLSRSAIFPSIFFRADSDGRFLEKQPLPELALSSDWQIAELRRQGSELEFRLDDGIIQRLPVPLLTKQVIGFRSGRHKAIVDDVVVRDARGELVIDENFRNDFSTWSIRGLLFLVTLTLIGLVLLLTRLLGVASKRVFSRFPFAVYLLVNLLILYLCFDFSFWSSHYPYTGYRPRDRGYSISSIEAPRRLGFDLFRSFDVSDEEGVVISRTDDLSSCYTRLRRFLNASEAPPPHDVVQLIRTTADGERFTTIAYDEKAVREYVGKWPLDADFKILFLGTSQTWGAGASHPEKSFVSHVHKVLATTTQRPLASINGSVSGFRAARLLERYSSHLGPIAPNLVVVNLSYNDETAGFGEGLRGIVRLNEERGAQTLFVLESASIEYDSRRLRKNHETMKRVAAEFGVPIVDLFAHISRSERDNLGLLWWDRVHLSSYGQSLAAELVADSDSKTLRPGSRAVTRRSTSRVRRRSESAAETSY